MYFVTKVENTVNDDIKMKLYKIKFIEKSLQDWFSCSWRWQETFGVL